MLTQPFTPPTITQHYCISHAHNTLYSSYTASPIPTLFQLHAYFLCSHGIPLGKPSLQCEDVKVGYTTVNFLKQCVIFLTESSSLSRIDLDDRYKFLTLFIKFKIYFKQISAFKMCLQRSCI